MRYPKVPLLIFVIITNIIFLGSSSKFSSVQIQGGGSIAFIRDGDIWLIETISRSQTQITSESEYIYLDWSPDGRILVALTSENQMHLVYPELKQVHLIEYSYVNLMNLVWSPDSHKLGYWIVDKLNSSMRILDINNREILLDYPTYGIPVFWDKSSEELFYYIHNSGLYKIDIGQGDQIQVFDYHKSFLPAETNYSSDSGWMASWLYQDLGGGILIFINQEGDFLELGSIPEPTGDWSHDGGLFIFQGGSTHFGYPGPINIYNIKDKSLKEFISEGGINPRWSPDDSLISYTRWKGGLDLIEINSGDIRSLLPDLNDEELPEHHAFGVDYGNFITTDWESKWSPDGRSLIFAYPSGFYIVDVSSESNQLIENAISPEWRPNTLTSSSEQDGIIAYVGTDDTEIYNYDIRLVNPDGSEMRVLPLDDTSPEKFVSTCYPGPKFSPDGKYLAIARSSMVASFQGPEELLVVSVHTGEIVNKIEEFGSTFDWSLNSREIIHDRDITWNGERPLDVEGLWVTNILSGDNYQIISPSSGNPLIYPKLSPDGNHVAFHEVVQLGGFGPFGVVEIDGSIYRVWNRQVGSFDWSPDGKELVFDDGYYGYVEGMKLFLANADGSNERILVDDVQIIPIYPQWSPKDNYISFINMKDDTGSLWLTKPDGSNLRQLTDGDLGKIIWFAWAPSGEKIVVSSERGLFVISIDGTSSFSIGQGNCPDWGVTLELQSTELYSISGRIVDFNTNNPIPEVIISDNLGNTAITDQDGLYKINELPIGTYTLTPSKVGYIFSPENLEISISQDTSGHDFIGSGDLDGDSLYDIWEIFGYDHNSDGTIDVDLPAMGADPNHKDIFVEIDYMVERVCKLNFCYTRHSHQLNPDAISLIVAAFNNAPVSNIDGSNGINLHVDNGPDSPMTDGKNWDNLSHSKEVPRDDELTWNEFDELRGSEENFNPARENIFHYAISAHHFDDLDETTECTTGMALQPGFDFVIALGGLIKLPEIEGFGEPSCEDPLLRNKTGTPFQQAGTFMHELGHNLGLEHGGQDDIKWKPNYLSVMNYTFQHGLIFNNEIGGKFDYSRSSQIPDLIESNLNETVGLNGGTSTANYGTQWFCPDGTKETILEANDAIDWNCDNIYEKEISANLNNNIYHISPPEETLKSYEDWSKLIFNGGGGNRSEGRAEISKRTLVTEMTLEEYNLLSLPYDVDLSGHRGGLAPPGDSLKYEFTLTNTGDNSDTYTLRAISSSGWADITLMPNSILLEPGASNDFTVQVNIPSKANLDDKDVLKIEVTSEGNPALWTSLYAVTEVNDVAPQPRETEQVQVNPINVLWLPCLVLLAGGLTLLVLGLVLAIYFRKKSTL